jgi:hypothetical protein
MSDCEYLEKCPVWSKFQSDIKNVWISGYCKGALQAKCARKKLVSDGKPVPENLLPNGSSLEN